MAYKKRSWLVAVIATMLGFIGLGIAYILLGLVTGVIAMCGWAPEWWAVIYFALAFTLPVLAVIIGVRARRAYLRRHPPPIAGEYAVKLK